MPDSSQANRPSQSEQYRLLNTPFTHAALAYYSRQGMGKILNSGTPFSEDRALEGSKDERFGRSVLNWSLSQGHIERIDDSGELRRSEGPKGLVFVQTDIMPEIVSNNPATMNAVKLELQMENAGDVGCLHEAFAYNAGHGGMIQSGALTVPAITYLEQAPLISGGTAGERLLAGDRIRESEVQAQIELNRYLFFKTLWWNRVIQVEEGTDQYFLTPRGKSALQKAGAAELTLSYFEMLENQYDLALGNETYGFSEGQICRDAELNAHASNGITKVAVAPHIVRQLSENPMLQEALAGGGLYIDYGSGGGHMLIQAAQEGPDTLRKLVGVDINEKTVRESRKIIAGKGLENRIEILKGSITDPDIMRILSSQVEKRGGGVASINTILHDIGPELSREFLRAHAVFMPNVPLIVTETPRIPMEVLQANPDSRAPSFQWLHDSSGQQLYFENQLRALLEECGFEILSEKSFGMLRDSNQNQYSQAVTWIARPRAGKKV